MLWEKGVQGKKDREIMFYEMLSCKTLSFHDDTLNRHHVVLPGSRPIVNQNVMDIKSVLVWDPNLQISLSFWDTFSIHLLLQVGQRLLPKFLARLLCIPKSFPSRATRLEYQAQDKHLAQPKDIPW